MKPQKPTTPYYEPFTRPDSVTALRNQFRADLPDADDLESFTNDPADQPAAPLREIITGPNGERKIIRNGVEYDYLEDDDDEDDDDSPDDDEPFEYQYDPNGAFILRSGTDWYEENDDDLPAEAMLFGPLWMQHELCILFADTNIGKSILAVQIADSLSRGLPIPGFALTAAAAPVLYFDFELSRQQFRSRYSTPADGKYPFTANFVRATLNPLTTKHTRFASYEDFLNNEIENALLACKAKTLIIDNITCMRNATQSAAGAQNLMEYLQNIKRRYQISILVLAHTPKRNVTKPLSRNDLQGSKMLINLADSAFAIGESQQQPGLRYIKQIKQRSISEAHGADNVCLGRITRTAGFLHFSFAGHGHENDHLAPHNEQYRRSTEHRISQLNAQGHSVRQIAARLGLAPTTVFRIIKRLERCADEKARGTCDSLPGEGREGFPEPEITYEELPHEEHPAALTPAIPPMTNDIMTNDKNRCADMQMCECADEKAPTTCDSLPGEGREGASEPVIMYEERPHGEHSPVKVTQSPPMTNDIMTNDQFTNDQPNRPPYIIEFPTWSDRKKRPKGKKVFGPPISRSWGNGPAAMTDPETGEDNLPPSAKKPITNDVMTNDQPYTYIPINDYLTMDDEIEGLTYLAKYEPMLFNRADEYRLEMLKKRKEGGTG